MSKERTEERTKTHARDSIDRRAALEVLETSADLIRRALDCTDLVGAERDKFEWGLGLIEPLICDMESLPPVDIREQLDNAYMHGATEAEAKYRAILDTLSQMVRCKDCNEYQDVHQFCKLHELEMQPMDFCSYGERKDAVD